MRDESTQQEDDWTTWSDAELLTRLIRRGVDPVVGKGYVQDRMTAAGIEQINEVLALVINDESGQPVRLETPLDKRVSR